jgi:response regulator of citrate/malate metabolism
VGTVVSVKIRIKLSDKEPTMQHVLIIEDDPPLASFYKRILEYNGYQSVCVSNCTEARTQLKVECPDLVLLDVILPDGNGFELLQSESTPTCALNKVVVVSSGDFKAEARLHGIAHYLNKPVSAESLLATVEHALAS